jgi:hypothetical protein
MEFIYVKGETTVDDIIEHILMRLNTDFTGGSLQVPGFCQISRYDYDRNMELKVRDKMYRHGVAKRSNGQGQPETAIVLTAKGVEVYEQGGWKKYLADLEEERAEARQKASQPANNITINAPVTGSQIGQSSEFGNLDLSHNSITREPTIIAAQPNQDAKNIFKNKESIWSKIYKWTDHKTISIIIAAILGFLATKLMAWLGWF